MTNPPTWSDKCQLLASPDDGSPLSLVQFEQQWALFSAEAGYVYPVIDDIPVLLGVEDRSYELEFVAVEPFLGAADASLAEGARRTIELLKERKGKKSFAWEDELHWTEAYSMASAEPVDDSRWNDRLWQRQPIVEAAEVDHGVEALVDIGCGEGQNFRTLLKDRISPECLYIGADISLPGLRLNRARNAWGNAIFIVCSADRLPLQPRSVDLICYFGIMHHTEKKAQGLQDHLKILRPGGRIILHEAIERARILSDRFRQHESAHEERFDVRELRHEIEQRSEEVSISYWKMRHSIFWSATLRILGPWSVLKPIPYKIITFIDHACIRILGPLLPWFRGGEVLAVLKRSTGAG